MDYTIFGVAYLVSTYRVIDLLENIEKGTVHIRTELAHMRLDVDPHLMSPDERREAGPGAPGGAGPPRRRAIRGDKYLSRRRPRSPRIMPPVIRQKLVMLRTRLSGVRPHGIGIPYLKIAKLSATWAP